LAGDPTAGDLASVDARLAEVARQLRNLVDQLANFGEAVATLVTEKLCALENQRGRLLTDRASILERRQTWEAAQAKLGELEAWCRSVATNLTNLTYQERRLALDALGGQARVWRTDHSPRYEITANIPLDGEIAVSTSRC
jgi:site-specific DNA recombinase